MATTVSANPPPTVMAASSRLSAMVEQAPYSPKWGTPVFRRVKEEPIHWFSRSPEKTTSKSDMVIPAFSASFRRASCCICFSACSQVFCPK